MASVQANGITIEYEEQGEGEPLLLVMGLGAQLIDWPQPLVDEIASRGFRVIRFDNRDAGLSTAFTSKPPSNSEITKAFLLRRRMRSEYLLRDMANDAIGLLDALGVERAHVVGASMGGMIAQTIAIDHPDRVLSLTSIMSTTGSRWVGQPTAKLILTAGRRPVPTQGDAVEMGIEMFRKVCGPTFDADEFRKLAEVSVARSFRPAGTGRQAAAIIASGDRTAALRTLRVPTLVMHGMLDPLVRPSGGVATAKAIPGARLVMFNDMAHDLPKTRHAEMADEIAAIAGIASGARPHRVGV
jgi:pimeloyl-ACP methyl ester carboxylesterase